MGNSGSAPGGKELGEKLREATENSELKELYFTSPIALMRAPQEPENKWRRLEKGNKGKPFQKGAGKGKGKFWMGLAFAVQADGIRETEGGTWAQLQQDGLVKRGASWRIFARKGFRTWPRPQCCWQLEGTRPPSSRRAT